MCRWLPVFVLMASCSAARGESRLVVVAEGSPLMKTPFGFDFLPNGELVVADLEAHRIYAVNGKGEVKPIAGTGDMGHRDGAGLQAKFNAPHNVVVDSAGDLLVSDTQNHCFRKINGKTFAVETLAGAPQRGHSPRAGKAADARFDQAYHIARAPGGYVIADIGNRRVCLIRDGKLATIAGNGERGVPADGALAAQSPLVDPRAVDVDAAGNIWILERSGHALRVVDPSGRISTVAGTGSPGPASDGPALQCTLRGPKFIWIEKSGDVLIADTDNHCIRRYSIQTKTLTTIAGTGSKGKGASGGKTLETAFNQPHGVGVSPAGVVYIADSHNGRILRIEE